MRDPGGNPRWRRYPAIRRASATPTRQTRDRQGHQREIERNGRQRLPDMGPGEHPARGDEKFACVVRRQRRMLRHGDAEAHRRGQQKRRRPDEFPHSASLSPGWNQLQ